MGMSNQTFNIHLMRDTQEHLRAMLENLGENPQTMQADWEHEQAEHDKIHTIRLKITGTANLDKLHEAIVADRAIEPAWKNDKIAYVKAPDSTITITRFLGDEIESNQTAIIEKTRMLERISSVYQRQIISAKVRGMLRARLESIAAHTGDDAETLFTQIRFEYDYNNLTIHFGDGTNAALAQLKEDLLAGGITKQTPLDIQFYGKRQLAADKEGNVRDAYFLIADAANNMTRTAGGDLSLLASTPIQPLGKQAWNRFQPSITNNIEI